ncbi:uncharacterized protein MONOS_8188 [Monocercomonoides exilis]|uniref:uncharacterized protein n=1 Tax=Monocercomonoides exilis TaxID=2049356 RepID=UPI0035595A01|nr:hypothetical protein MONOS_8188 [Monocercomonoides exilis]|eukprot:MONOS_8188.1-p1 / transcript=MONOS_8188.1 / gene=MONOS_8188 / organism=Monocercomonoides_exilis_PA203 / gene_product=unspecified product / transcript_product=unspecified product / location=Mono_scaffold00302:4185-5114(-) / protein_length=310 / sequence_SO=supercontig / SO=protein_coding / is_pseudo=false
MPKTCDLVPLCPPYYPCTCAHKCDCLCHGKEQPKSSKTLPYDPDAFNTTSRGFHKPPSDEDYPTSRQYRPTDNLGTDPSLVPMATEMKRQYTPKHVDHEPLAKSRSWKGSEPFDPHTMTRDSYKAPSSADYPARVRSFNSPMKSEPGKFDTTYRQTYIKPSEDLYSPSVGPGETKARSSPPGLFDTEYRTNYLGEPTERSLPFKSSTQPLGTRPTDFTTTTRGTYKSPSSDDYPTRERAFKGVPESAGPLGRLESTARETYKDPGRPDDKHIYKPQDSKLIVGPSAPFETTSRSFHGPKSHFCCGCSSK